MSKADMLTTDSWIGDLHAGDSNGATTLWLRYHDKLVRLAYYRLNGSAELGANEEDVVVSAFTSFFRALEENRASCLQTEDEIWRLLVTLTARKAIKLLRHEGRAKRNHFLTEAADSKLDDIVGTEPTPEFAAALIDEFRLLNERLVDDEMRMIAFWKMEGFSNTEIAQELNCSVRTIKRRLAVIRSLLADEIDQQTT